MIWYDSTLDQHDESEKKKSEKYLQKDATKSKTDQKLRELAKVFRIEFVLVNFIANVEYILICVTVIFDNHYLIFYSLDMVSCGLA